MHVHVHVCLPLALSLQLAAKVSALQQQIVDIERQKQMVHEYLFSNSEAVTRVQKEVKSSTASEFYILSTFLSGVGLPCLDLCMNSASWAASVALLVEHLSIRTQGSRVQVQRSMCQLCDLWCDALSFWSVLLSNFHANCYLPSPQMPLFFTS